MSFLSGTNVELLYSLSTPVTKNTFTTQALIGPLAASAPVPKIPAGFFSDNPNPIGRCLYLQVFGLIGTTGTPTFSPAVALDTAAGTALNPITIYSLTTQTATVIAQWQCQVWITCTAFGETAGMTLQVNGQWSQATVASGGAGNASGISGQFATSLTGLNATLTYYIELFGTWGTSSVSNTTTIQQMFLFGLN